MTNNETSYLDKALESLDGAASEYTNRRYNNCANRCYYAMFQAAVYALEQVGVRHTGRGYTWPHEALQATFVQELIQRRKVYPSEFRAVLTRNASLRESADYDRHWVTETQAARALGRTRDFVVAMQRGGGN
jgi:uncharacterized protein (UPF0332 family)